MNDLLTESQEFHLWLKRNDNRLRFYAPDEVARLALTCGFSIATICPAVNDRLSHIRALMTFWESPLSEQWLDLAAYNDGHDQKGA